MVTKHRADLPVLCVSLGIFIVNNILRWFCCTVKPGDYWARQFYTPSSPWGLSQERHCLHSNGVWALKPKTPDSESLLGIPECQLSHLVMRIKWSYNDWKKQNTPRLAHGTSRFSINVGHFQCMVMTQSYRGAILILLSYISHYNLKGLTGTNTTQMPTT